MIENQQVLAVIPARGGSKRIRRKNLRLLGGKPLISHIVDLSLESRYIDKVVVSTEDDLIGRLVAGLGVAVTKRPTELAQDAVPLDPVIYDAVRFVEQSGETYDVVATLQPTSPLLKTETLDDAFEFFVRRDCDTLISVVNEPHLLWKYEGRHATPLYDERRNSQLNATVKKESGAFLITRRSCVGPESRIGDYVDLYEVSNEEAVDIDWPQDFHKAQSLLSRKKVLFHVIGGHETGLGHAHRCMTLADELMTHDTRFLVSDKDQMTKALLLEAGYAVDSARGLEEEIEIVADYSPDVLVIDVLDTSREYMETMRGLAPYLVTFEDLGAGADLADAVVNALYEHSAPPENHHYGYRYVVLRDEFFLFPPKPISKDVENVLVTFGGTDPSDLTGRMLNISQHKRFANAGFTFILGLGYQHSERLHRLANRMDNVEVFSKIDTIAKHMAACDIGVTSNGRTIYEFAALGVPCISVAQNEREARHLFSTICKGVRYLGLATTVSDGRIITELSNLMEDYAERTRMREALLSFDLLKGRERVVEILVNRQGTKNAEKSRD